MSSKATNWAWHQKVKPASTKLLLMAIAEFANPETALAWPSVKAIEEMTGLNRKTIFSGLDQLTKPRENGGLGVLTDTGKREGRTQQIVVYRMSFEPVLGESVPKTGHLKKAGGTVPISDGKSPVFTTEESRKRDTEPSIGTKEGTDPPSPDGEGTPPVDELSLFGGALEEEPPMPIEDFVVEAWHALKRDFPGVADIDVLSDDRVKRIRSNAERVVAARKRNGIRATPESVWTEIFANIRRSTFYTGRDPPGPKYSKPFKLRIDYVLRPRDFMAILEDNDDGRSSDDHFDGSGRRRGPAESATRRVLSRL